MLQFIQSQFALYFAIGLVLFVPGYFLIFASRMHRQFSSLESFVLAFASSIVVMDFLIILLGKTGIGINKISVISSIIFFAIACSAIYFFLKKRRNAIPYQNISPEKKSPALSKKSFLLLFLLIFLSIFIKTIYFQDTIFPTATDLGHHMYWTKTITTTGQLPKYEKSDIGPDFTIGKPAPIADFIIGEHLIFSAIALISGAEFISAFPAIVLFLVQIMSLLAIFILARYLFKKSPQRYTIALTALFLIGPLWSLASPQAKFVSGGVIGNTIGNLLILLAILLFAKAFTEKKSAILAYALFISLGMAYTHHLSTFVFIFASFFTALIFAIFNVKKIKQYILEIFQLFKSPAVWAILIMGAIFVFFIYTPTYLNTKAIDTAVGAPSKATRTGLTLTQLKSTAGEARFAFAVIGILVLFFARKLLGKYRQAFLIGWIFALTIMSLRPDWLFVDIPSNRIASYVVFPTAIISAYMIVYLFTAIISSDFGKNYLKGSLVLIIFFVLLSFVTTNGLYDNAQSLNTSSSVTGALETYNASQYLADKTNSSDIILKDHNYLSGDSWIKLFFMRGYNYPLSRGYFKRYEDSASREQCTNFMISNPASDEAKKCFNGTHADFIMIDPKLDSAQFHRMNEFWQVYQSDSVGIFYRKN